MELIAGLLLVIGSGFYSGSETAVYRARWVRLTTWANTKVAGARLALRLLRWREPTVVAVLIGTNLCNVFVTILVSEFVARTLGPQWTGVAVLAVVVFTLVFGEYVPKALAQAGPSDWLRRVSLPLAASLGVFAPAVLVLTGVARIFATPFARPRARVSLTRHDFVAEMRQRERQNGREETASPAGPPVSRLVARLFRFSGLRLAEAAIPLERVQAVPEGASRQEVLAVIGEHGFSRIPVYRDAPENIIGVMFARDLLAPGAYRLGGIDRYRESERAMEVLERMRRRGSHIAVVTDASGRTTGLVTLEDILEELVGEIRSED
jgi:putative hemolysin